MTDNQKAKDMYEIYKLGYSLTEVGQVFGVTRQSVYDVFKRRNFELRKKNQNPFQYFNGNKYTLRNHGYYSKTNGNRSLMHRDVWEHHNGKIKNPEIFDIHHLDRDRSNNDINNLELIRKDEHARRYSTGKNQYTKNKGEC